MSVLEHICPLLQQAESKQSHGTAVVQVFVNLSQSISNPFCTVLARLLHCHETNTYVVLTQGLCILCK